MKFYNSNRGMSLKLAFVLLVPCMTISATVVAQTLFEEDFDTQPDWTSTMHSLRNAQEANNGDVIPKYWDKIYQRTEWSPEKGFADNHSTLEILSSNSEKARDGMGKSAVFWRESFSLGWKNWASDAQFIKILDDYYDEIYIEFWIRFSPNWWQRDSNNYGNWISKIFRVGSYSGDGIIFNGAGGEVGPRFIWSYKKDKFGVRNVLTLLKGPHGSGGDTPTGLGGSKNFKSSTKGMGVDGSDPKIPDLVNGGYLLDASGSIDHEQVYGSSEIWTKMGFYLKLNSAPGVADGVLKQWINDERFNSDESITWIPEGATEEQMLGWNYFAIGGNDYFQPFPNDQRFEDWYSIDDVKVLTVAPEMNAVPNAPINVLYRYFD